MRRAFLALALILSPPAWAGDASSAEHVRLSEEMRNLARRQVWKGVERNFLAIQAMGREPSHSDLLNGAHAARALGKVGAAYERLRAAAKIEADKAVIDSLWAIDQHYGRVELSGRKGTELDRADLPFDPMARVSIAYAVGELAEHGRFVGALPLGTYTLDGAEFQVGLDHTVVLASEGRRRTPRNLAVIR